jgi:hypothetical protein
MKSVYQNFYLLGYRRWEMPRWVRRVITKTELHRAWLSGFHGRFIEQGVEYGPTNPYGRQ